MLLGALSLAAWGVVAGVSGISSAVHAHAEQEHAQTQQRADAASAALADARTGALGTYARGSALADVVDATLVADAAVIDALGAELTALAERAALDLGPDGAATLADAAAPEPEERAIQDAEARAADIAARAAAVEARTNAVVEAEHAWGAATSVPDAASAPDRSHFTETLAALEHPDADADLADLVTAFQDAYRAMVDSGSRAATALADDSCTGSPAPTFVKGVLVVNKTYGLPACFGSGLTAETRAAFEALRAEASAQGFTLSMNSGFRSYQSQTRIYGSFAASEGRAEADRHSARPGFSEHQTGLAFDLNPVDQSFGRTAAGRWVAANAHRFGLIVRYPEGKDGVTGYMWEPWHLRYVGVPLATTLSESGQSLEEYLGVTSAYAD